MNATLVIGGLALAISSTLLAQAPTQSGGPQTEPTGMRPCAQEPDPAKCEARRKEMRERFKQAREACKGKEGRALGQCIAQLRCAKAANPTKCQADAKERREHRLEMRDKSASKGAPKF